MSANNVFVIVPACNEQETIYQTVLSLLQMKMNVIVVDDGSRLSQFQFLKTLPVYYIRHAINLGQGAALQTGTEFALEKGADFIIHFDADGQHQPNDLPGLLKPLLDNKADLVMGSRFLSHSNKIPFLRTYLLKTARWVNYCFTGILLSDAHNGLRAFNRNTAQQLRFTENRMSHATELLFHIKRYQWRWCEVSVNILYKNDPMRRGQSTLNSVRIFFDLLLYKFFQ